MSRNLAKIVTILLVSALMLSVVLEGAARIVLYRAGWQDTWDYLTVKDRDLGFRVRAGVATHFTGADIRTNLDGFRAAGTHDHLSRKSTEEVLVAVIGDSNTFGASTPYEQTFPVVLEQSLRKNVSSAVRVLNLAAPAYSTYQSAALIKKWMHLRPDVLVVTANTYNDRVFLGRPDSVQLFRFEYGFIRPYEFGTYVSYPLLYWHLKHTLPDRLRQQGIPSFNEPIPIPRVPIDQLAYLLRHLVEMGRRNSMAVVFLATGNPYELPESEAALAALGGRRYADAFTGFERLRKQYPGLFLPSYYAYQSARASGDHSYANTIREEYERNYKQQLDHYATNFSYFDAEYFSVIRDVADHEGVLLVDLRGDFEKAYVEYSNGRYPGHYGPRGHAIVAQKLAAALRQTISKAMYRQ